MLVAVVALAVATELDPTGASVVAIAMTPVVAAEMAYSGYNGTYYCDCDVRWCGCSHGCSSGFCGGCCGRV